MSLVARRRKYTQVKNMSFDQEGNEKEGILSVSMGHA